MYETGLLSVKFYEKDQCGDAISIFDQDKFILLILADGVSSCSSDHLASQKTIELVRQNFVYNKNNIERSLVNMIQRSNLELNSFSGSKSLLSTLVVLYWEKGSQEIHYASIGDSRLYLKNKDEIKALTKDDSVNIKGKNYVTQVMGIQDELSPQYGKLDFNVNDMFVLTSDGFHELSSFEKIVDHLYNSQDLQNALDRNKDEISSANKDDASIIAFRSSEKLSDIKLCKECVDNKVDFRGKDISAQQILKYIQNMFLNSNSEIEMLNMAEYILEYDLHYGRDVLIAMLEKAIKINNHKLVDFARSQIKRL